jgi:hypothetical protein
MSVGEVAFEHESAEGTLNCNIMTWENQILISLKLKLLEGFVLGLYKGFGIVEYALYVEQYMTFHFVFGKKN